ncbi:juvenile hormone epoxide hydrolase 1-like [Cylas formicarius]|uniref:juvenile hormone epoxide hydrolase 1-like n=1 Tax=Cylas formicarius TaxID=197179 RepID=UPI0029585EA8|nr:juvenile hormone epoxide hydrolase 1-like [Cylas formicarius]
MGLLAKGALGAVLLTSAYLYFKISKVPPVPHLEDTWWGPGKPTKEDIAVKPFKINVPIEVIKDLRHRLEISPPFQTPLEGANQNYGINAKLLQTVVDYWKSKYDWPKREEFLNQYPQYQTKIQGLNIHFIHVKPRNAKGLKVLPMLMVHGWPGSIREFYEIIPLLTEPQPGRNYVFELVIPSLPGYGFSDGAARPGLATAQMAHIFKRLMERLNFDKYYLQGGDWGSLVTQNLAALYPDNVIGVHGNTCFVNSPRYHFILALGSYFPSLVFENEAEKFKNSPYSKTIRFMIEESGYLHIQATKPDTVGVGLRESPAGLAAYILEKFITWTNPTWKNLPDGGLTRKFTLDQLLDNVMIYWVTKSITTSARLYAENFASNNTALQIDEIPIKVPTGCARFAYELLYPPRKAMGGRFPNLVHLTDYEDGGHFAAFEIPSILAEDIYQFVDKVERLKIGKQEL